MRIRRRMQHLEQSARRHGLATDGCPACWHRRRVGVVVRVRQRPDGTLEYPDTAPPEPCVGCGRRPEFLIRMHEPLDAETEESNPGTEANGGSCGPA